MIIGNLRRKISPAPAMKEREIRHSFERQRCIETLTNKYNSLIVTTPKSSSGAILGLVDNRYNSFLSRACLTERRGAQNKVICNTKNVYTTGPSNSW
jgi:hypothetical protein